MKLTRESTTCARCNRAVYVEDVDSQGLCVFCHTEPKEEKKK